MATGTSDKPNAATVTRVTTPKPTGATAVGERIPHPSQQERHNAGRALRTLVPRVSHGAWTPASDRVDPISLLESQAATRIPELVPIRHGRMLASPFAFLRGSAIVMAHDLATTQSTGIRVQCCGDAHMANFGVFASPERNLVFDINDFDETLPGPWEWDLKRLAASLVVAGRYRGFSASVCRDAALAAARGYHDAMAKAAQMGNLDVWYTHFTVDQLESLASSSKLRKGAGKIMEKNLKKEVAKARTRTSLMSLDKMTEVVNGERQIISLPPVVTRLDSSVREEEIRDTFHAYRRTLDPSRRILLEQYRLVDVAQKVVGVGSVGTAAFIAYLEGLNDRDPLFLQFKEAQASVLSIRYSKSVYKNHGERIVVGQRTMQAASDIFLGWTRGPAGRDLYGRQLRDMKGSADIETMIPDGLALYARFCAATLARAHARSGDRVQIASYIGTSDVFDQAIVKFAETYADQTERDYEAMAAAVKSGRIKAEMGV